MGKTNITPLVKKWVPPVLLDSIAGFMGKRVRIAGDYKTWEEASNDAEGYAADEILLRVKKATEQALQNHNQYERDGVVFEEAEYPFQLIATLLRAATEAGGQLTVLDFGGSLGSTYYQCREFLSGVKDLKWCVVEQDHFVICGKKDFQTGVLKFYGSIEECYRESTPTVILFSSVLQYLKAPERILAEVAEKRPAYIVIDRTPVVDHNVSHIALQLVPQSMGKASYPVRLFLESELIRYIGSNYRRICTFSALDTNLYYRNKLIEFKGIIFQKK